MQAPGRPPLSPVQALMLYRVAIFVDRQRLVFEAMRELRPDHYIRAYEPWRIGQDFTRASWQAFFRYYSGGPGRGSWGPNNEWNYRLHGVGCHLTHRTTGEVIGWDMGRVEQFDRNWFLDHLKWAIDQNPSAFGDLPSLEDSDTLRQFVFEVLDQLVDLDYLAGPDNPRRLQRYRLLWSPLK